MSCCPVLGLKCLVAWFFLGYHKCQNQMFISQSPMIQVSSDNPALEQWMSKKPCDIPCTSWLIGMLTCTYLGSITSCDKLPTRASVIAYNSLVLYRWFHCSQPWHFRMFVLIRRLTYLILLSISEEICPTILIEEIEGLHLHSHVQVQYYKNPFEVIFISTGQLSFFHQCTSCTTNSNPKSLMPTKGLWNHLRQRFHEDFGTPKIWNSSPSSSLYINQYYPTRSGFKKQGREKSMEP